MKYRIPHSPQAAEKEYLDLILVPVFQVCLRFHFHIKTKCEREQEILVVGAGADLEFW